MHNINPKGKFMLPGDLSLKSHPKDYEQKWTCHYGHPSKYKPRPNLLNPSVLGGWPQWYVNSHYLIKCECMTCKTTQFNIYSHILITYILSLFCFTILPHMSIFDQNNFSYHIFMIYINKFDNVMYNIIAVFI